MCEYADQLILFLDHELPPEEAVKVELHLENCEECREQLGVFTRVSRDVAAYCDEAMAVHAWHVTPPWKAVSVAACVVTACLALWLAWPRALVTQSAIEVRSVGTINSLPLARNEMLTPTPSILRDHRRQTVTEEPRLLHSNSKNSAPEQSLTAYTSPAVPIIQIAIPADEIFPPGALPEGINFIADMTVTPDGTADGMRLRPTLVGFERRTTAP